MAISLEEGNDFSIDSYKRKSWIGKLLLNKGIYW